MMSWKWIAIAALPFLLAGAGCDLISGQITIVENFGSGIGTVDGTINQIAVDLTDNEDYEEHGDKIQSVEAFGFVVEVQNLTGGEATGEGYLSLTNLGLSPSVETLDSLATKIFSNMDLPLAIGEIRTVTFEESQDYVLGLDAIEEAVEDGTFYLYGVTSVPGVKVQYLDFTVIVTVNVEM